MCKEDSPLNLARRFFWPVSVAIAFLVFLGASSSGNFVRSAYADEGDICEIRGPRVIAEGETYLYTAFLDGTTAHSFTATTDNIIGKSRITSVLNQNFDEDDDDNADEDDNIIYKKITGVNLVDAIYPVDIFDLSDEVVDQLTLVDPSFVVPLNGCGVDPKSLFNRIVADLKLAGVGNDISSSEQAAAVAAIIAAINERELDSFDQLDCTKIGLEAGKAAAGAGAASVEAQQLEDAVTIICRNDFVFDKQTCLDIYAYFNNKVVSTVECQKVDEVFFHEALIIDVTCFDAGTFEITFTDESEDDDSLTIPVVCRGAPDSDSTITVQPNKVEIVPALGSVSHSLVTVTLLTDDEQAAPGFEVDFTVDRCTIEVSGVDTASEYAAARTVFNNYNVNVAQTGADIENSAAAGSAIDSSRNQDTVTSFVNTAGDATVAAAILGCSPGDTGNTVASPGVATITAIIEVDSGQDIVKTINVSVVGPPASVTVSASPTSLRCGEKATITATVLDSIGQNVSEHTRVEAVTNAGGVLGGTGAVAGLAGPVVPISSTVSETFSGKASFYLLTSQQHSGPYEVVVTSGGNGSVTSSLGGVFSTPPVSAQATVSCNVPTVAAPAAPLPTIAAPATGLGTITPPNTGDAGLAQDSRSSWGLFAAVLAIAFGVTGLAGLRSSRR